MNLSRWFLMSTDLGRRFSNSSVTIKIQNSAFETTVPIHQLSSPQPAQPKEWDPPYLPRSPLGLPTSLHGSNALNWPGISQLGTPRTQSCSRSAHCSLLKALVPFPHQENATQVHGPFFYRHANHISSCEILFSLMHVDSHTPPC
jgi:hypothetical protein